ncbi:MAG: CoA-binding protein [Dichotomicrobium sp.]
MTALTESDDALKDILTRCRRFAVIIASANPARPSYEVMRYLIDHGYEVFPVNPGWAGREILGRPVVASLRDLPCSVDVVDVFRHPDGVPEIARDAIAIGAKVLWMQIGASNDEAAKLAQAAGLQVVAERCPKIEHARLIG